MRACVLTAVAGISIVSTLSSAVVVQLPAAKDNTLFEDPSGSLSSGIGANLFVGMTQQNSKRRALIGFDFATIPSGSTINSVRLTLRMSKTITATELIGLHFCNASWGEGTSDSNAQGGGGGAPATPNDATWTNRFFGGAMWSALGGDFAPSASAITAVTGVASYNWTSSAMRDEVQQWLNNPLTNFGWLIQGNEGDPGSTKRFDSRENGTPSFRPVLQVDYTPVPAAGACGLLAAAGLVTSRRRRK